MTEREKLRLAQEQSQSQWKKETAKAVKNQTSAQVAARLDQVISSPSGKKAVDTKSAQAAARLDSGTYAVNIGTQKKLVEQEKRDWSKDPATRLNDGAYAENRGMQKHLALQRDITSTKKKNDYYHNQINAYNNLNMMEDVYRAQKMLEESRLRLDQLEKDSLEVNQKVRSDRWIRQMQYYDELRSKPDFTNYSAKGAEIINPTYFAALGEETITGKYRLGAPIGNIVTFSQENADTIRNREETAGLPGKVSYTYLNESEIETYNYLLAKDLENGTHGAEQYLSFLQEELNRREGEAISRRIEETENDLLRNAWRNAYGFGAGYNQAEKGIAQLGQKKPLPQSATQYASYNIREDLANVGPQIPYLDASLGQLAYDFMHASGYSAPAAIASAALPAAGTAVVGLSSYGNNDNRALQEGYTPEQAERYAKTAALVEAAVSAAISHTAKLAQNKMETTKLVQKLDDSRFGRMAMAANAQAAANSVEEYLQEQTEPLIRNLLLGEQNAIDLRSPEALRAAVLGGARNLHRQRVSEAEFRDQGGEFWRNIAPGAKEEQAAVRASAHQEMVRYGQVVKVSEEALEKIWQYDPELSNKSKAEKDRILAERKAALKEKVQGSLRELQKKPLNMEVKGKLLRVELYEKGIQKATKDLTAKKAAILLQLEDVLKNARYLYSTPDYNRNSNTHRRNYFCTPVQMGNEKYVAEIIVADNKVTKESQVVEMNLNRDTPLDGGRMGKAAGPAGVSSGVLKYSIVNSPFAVNRVNLTNRHLWQMPVWPVGNLTSPVQTQAEMLRQMEAMRAQYRKELEKAEMERAFLHGFDMEE